MYYPKPVEVFKIDSLDSATRDTFQELQANRYKLETKLIKHFFYGAGLITSLWVLCLFAVITCQFLLDEKLELSDAQFIALFTTTTATVISLWGTSGYFLFKKEKQIAS